jgi:hypothetical protein
MAGAATSTTFRTLRGRPGRLRAAGADAGALAARRARSTTRRLAQADQPGLRHRAAAGTSIQIPERRQAA